MKLWLTLALVFTVLIPCQAVSINVIHPKSPDSISSDHSSTFVIGTVEPANSSVTCNGVPCDVSADGAFIGYCPVRSLPEKAWEKVEDKICDGYFEFIARNANEHITERIPVYSQRSPSNFSLSQHPFDPSELVEFNKDRLYALEGKQLGDVVFIPKGCILPSAFGNVSNYVCKTALGTEVSVSVHDANVVDQKRYPSPQPSEFEIPNQNTIVKSGLIGWVWPEDRKLWGFQVFSKKGETHIEARWKIRGDGQNIDQDSPLQGVRICLDPGHNPDPGAIGPRGLEERKSTLLLGRVLAAKLKEKGAIVDFSHEDDALLLTKRHDRIRELKPDILISLHNNSVGDDRDPRLRHGTETYYLYPWSKPLADSVHSAMIKVLNSRDLGCIKRNLYITRFPDCPAILIEPEYLILPEIEKKFMDPEQRNQLADAIIDGITTFLRSSDDLSQKAEENP